jgi:hypothetical protein
MYVCCEFESCSGRGVQHYVIKFVCDCNMVSMLTSSAVDREFEPGLGKTKDYKIGICWFSAKACSTKE